MAINVFPAPISANYNPTELTLRHSITSTGEVTIPSNITQVFAVVIGGGGGGNNGNQGHGGGGGGGGGGISYGWIVPSNSAIIGAGGTSGNNGNPSSYGQLIAGGGGAGSVGSVGTGPITHMGVNPFNIGSTTNSGVRAVFARNGSRGGANSNSTNTTIQPGFYNEIYQTAEATDNGTPTPYESGLGVVFAPPGAWQRGPAETGINGNTNGVSGSGGSGKVASTFSDVGGNGGYGYFAAGGGAAAALGGNTNYFTGGTPTRIPNRGGGGGAGALGNGATPGGVVGGAGGSGGGGGGGAANGNATAGAGGSGAVLIYY